LEGREFWGSTKSGGKTCLGRWKFGRGREGKELEADSLTSGPTQGGPKEALGSVQKKGALLEGGKKQKERGG